MKHCPRCKTSRNKKDFHKNKRYNDNLCVYCKPCARSIAKISYMKNRNKILEKNRNNRSTINLYKKQKYHNDIQYKLSCVLRVRLRQALQKNKTDEQQVHLACHCTNLQPLWAQDNLKKNANIEVSEVTLIPSDEELQGLDG